MRGTPTTFWGKLDRDDKDEVTAWHPLVAHCADVAACTEALLDCSVLRHRFARLGEVDELHSVHVARLAFLSALHDIGKYNLGFQRKGDPEPKHTAGHVAEVMSLFGSEYEAGEQLLAVLPVEQLADWSPDEGAVQLLVAAIGHHGRPVAYGAGTPDPSLWRAARELKPFAGIAELVAAAQAWFPRAFEHPEVTLPATPALQHAFAGLVMLADWLGSDRHDDMFPFAEDLGDRMPFARSRARRAVALLGLDAAAARLSLGAHAPGFEQVWGLSPRDAQQRTLSLPSDAAGSLTVLESETGSGKTEAALARFLHLFHAGQVDGMTFALPTRTAATQIHSRVVECMKRAFPDESSRPPVVLAVPGYLQFDEARGRRMAGFEVLWADDASERWRHRGWAAEHPKRYLAGAVVVGTIDQVLLSSLRVNHAHLRATALLRHLLVVDEVHASDAYMNRILEEVLRFHLGADGHALLMSATLGGYVRWRLERAARAAPRFGAAGPSLASSLAVPYPAVHYGVVKSDRKDPETFPVASPGLPKTMRTQLEAIADHPEIVAERALRMARQGARVLVLRNTVSDAVATQLALESIAQPDDATLLFRVRDVVTLHHARFARSDRMLLDEAIDARFGKAAPQDGGVVAVSTQTVQQSLDLDADILLTDLAPMDVLLQRMGRVHRHRERDPHRPATFRAARVIVMMADTDLGACLRASGEASGPHGVGTVYEDVLILEATRQQLEQRPELRIPEDNRALVESTTHPDALEKLADALRPAWGEHRRKVTGVFYAHVGLAGLNLVERDKVFGEYSFKRTELAERIAARLGESDRRAVFAKHPIGPFGQPVAELTILGWMARDLPSDPKLAPTEVEEDQSAGEVRFRFAHLAFVYDRLGLRTTHSVSPSEQPGAPDG